MANYKNKELPIETRAKLAYTENQDPTKFNINEAPYEDKAFFYSYFYVENRIAKNEELAKKSLTSLVDLLKSNVN